MRISDWSSDVCSADLSQAPGTCFKYKITKLDLLDRVLARIGTAQQGLYARQQFAATDRFDHVIVCTRRQSGPNTVFTGTADRKSVMQGNSVAIRVDLRRRSFIQKKNTRDYTLY